MADAAEQLYAVPPSAFTATRDRVAAELRKAGRAADAQAIGRLRKPSAALWAVNRLARVDRHGVAAFVAAVERLRRQQLRDPRAAADTLRVQRAALDELAARARSILTEAHLSASPTVLRRVADTLLGAAVDHAHAEALRRGVLTQELPAPGFEAFGGVAVPRATLRLVKREERDRSAADAHRPAARHADAERHAAEARREEEDRRERAARETERLRREADEQQRVVARLEADAVAARATLAELERRLREARQAARRAATAAARGGRR